MANSSYSSSINSFNEPFTKEQEMTLYNSINMVELRETFVNIRLRKLRLAEIYFA